MKQMFNLLLIIAASCLSLSSSIAKETFPEAEEVFINDYAEVLTAGDRDLISSMLHRLHAQTGIQFSVVTIRSLADYSARGLPVKVYADQLMDHWGVGDKNRNDDILLLLAQNDRVAAISMGAGYLHRYDSELQQIIDRKMIPHFRQADYSKGIYEGVNATIAVVTTEVGWFALYKWHLLAAGIAVVCILAGISCLRAGRKGWGWTFFALAGIIVLYLVKSLLKRGSSGGGFGGGRSGGGGASGSW